MKKIMTLLFILGMLPTMAFAQCAYFIPTDFHGMQYGFYGYMYDEDGKRCTGRQVYFKLDGINYEGVTQKERDLLLNGRWKLGAYKRERNGVYQGVLLDDTCGASMNEKILRDRKWAQNYRN